MAAEQPSFGVRTTPGFRWFPVRFHRFLSTWFRDVVLRRFGTMVLSSSKEEEERESYAIALSPLILSAQQTEACREEGGP